MQAIGVFTATTVGGLGREPSDKELQGGIVGYGVMNIIGAVFGGLPTATYSQNVGIVATTKVVNRCVLGLAAIILGVAGLIPKFSALLTTIPQCVLGGATVSVFASIAMTGMKPVSYTHLVLYFVRNIFSSYTGEYVATIIINVNKNTLIDFYNAGIDREWFIYLYNDEINLITDSQSLPCADEISGKLDFLNNETYLEEIDAGGQSYLTAAEKLPNLDMTSVVAAPRNQVLEKLNDTLRTYMLVLAVIVTLVLCISIIISRAVTRPVSYTHLFQGSTG